MPGDILLHPFTLGLGLGLVFVVLALWKVIVLKHELGRFKNHLSDRLEIEADHLKRGKAELETLKKENEQLRIRIAEYNFAPEWKAHRQLEVYARAEKTMLFNVPGFAPAWETAKNAAHENLQEEEAGRSLPKRIFSRLFGPSGKKLVKDSADPANQDTQSAG